MTTTPTPVGPALEPLEPEHPAPDPHHSKRRTTSLWSGHPRAAAPLDATGPGEVTRAAEDARCQVLQRPGTPTS